MSGPPLIYARQIHSCAMIRRDAKNPSLSVITVGGENGGILTPVEILDEGSNKWRLGPYLPVPTMAAGLVEDPRGGVILIGGHNGPSMTNLIYRLQHGASHWELLTQKLKIGNHYHVAFFIPDSLASNCTIN